MKATRLIGILMTAMFVLFAPVAANADYAPETGGVSNDAPTPSGDGCFTTNVTVRGGAPGEQLTLTVRNSSGAVVFQESRAANADGNATFSVRLCEAGTFTATGTDSDGDVLGTSQFTIPRAASAGPRAGDGGSGNLPATGSDTRSMLALGGGLALLAVGGVALVAARRRNA